MDLHEIIGRLGVIYKDLDHALTVDGMSNVSAMNVALSQIKRLIDDIQENAN